jgi:hypothetical protein
LNSEVLFEWINNHIHFREVCSQVQQFQQRFFGRDVRHVKILENSERVRVDGVENSSGRQDQLFGLEQHLRGKGSMEIFVLLLSHRIGPIQLDLELQI